MEWIVTWLNEAASPWLSFMLNSALQLSLLVLAVTLVTFALRNRPARLLYLLWSLVFIKALVPPALSLPYVENTSITGALIILPPIMPAISSQEIGNAGISFGGFILAVWFTTVLGALSLLLVRNVRFFRRLKGSYEFEAGAIPPAVSAALNGVKVLTNPVVVSPFTSGIIRSSIYLPMEASNWSKQKIASVLMHELGHVRRNDFLAGLLQTFVGIFFFFHPFVWFANSRISRLREMACDDFAIQETRGNAVDYGKSLLEFFTRGPDFHPRGVANCFHQKKHIMISRFEYIINRKEAPMSKLRSVDKLIIAGLLAFSLVLSVACSDALDSNAANGSQSNPDRILGHDETDADVKEFFQYDEEPIPVDGMQGIMANLHYPKIARLAGIEGRVVVRALIDESGSVIDTEIVESIEGDNGCDEAAINAVKNTKWAPARLKGKEVKSRVAIPIIFRLSKKERDAVAK